MRVWGSHMLTAVMLAGISFIEEIKKLESFGDSLAVHYCVPLTACVHVLYVCDNRLHWPTYDWGPCAPGSVWSLQWQESRCKARLRAQFWTVLRHLRPGNLSFRSSAVQLGIILISYLLWHLLTLVHCLTCAHLLKFWICCSSELVLAVFHPSAPDPVSCRLCLIHFPYWMTLRPLNQAFISFASVFAYARSFPEWLFRFLCVFGCNYV